MIGVTETQIVIVLAVIAVHFIFREAVFERATARKDNVSFPPVFGLRGVYWLGIPAFLFATYRVYFAIRSGLDWIYPGLFLGLAALIFFSYPGTISLGSGGIYFRRYLGLRRAQLKWDEVGSVVSSRVLKTITVYGHDGASITHTQFNVDPSRFKAELRVRLAFPILEQ